MSQTGDVGLSDTEHRMEVEEKTNRKEEEEAAHRAALLARLATSIPRWALQGEVTENSWDDVDFPLDAVLPNELMETADEESIIGHPQHGACANFDDASSEQNLQDRLDSVNIPKYVPPVLPCVWKEIAETRFTERKWWWPNEIWSIVKTELEARHFQITMGKQAAHTNLMNVSGWYSYKGHGGILKHTRHKQLHTAQKKLNAKRNKSRQ